MNTQLRQKRVQEPFLRIASKNEMSAQAAVLLRLGVFLLSLAAGGLFLLAVGYNPFEIYGAILDGSFRSAMAIQATVKVAVPLVISALAATLAFKMRFWNIGVEGQIIIGAVFTTFFALFYPHWNHWVLVIVMFIAGALGGGLWGLIPAWFKTRYGTNETLLTLMLNYIALHMVALLRDGPWRDRSSQGYSAIARFGDNAALDKVFGVHFGWIIALLLVALIYVYLGYTKQGYEISVVGESQDTARYAGMDVKKIVLRTMFLSGAVAGIGGTVQAAGADVTLTTSVAGGVGFTGIIIAWLSRLNAAMILMISCLFAILEKGFSVVQSDFGLSADSADILQGIILFFVLGCEFFIRYKFVLRKKRGVS